MEEVDGDHVILEVVSEDIGVVAFGGGHALLLVQVFDGGDEIAILGGEFVLFGLGSLRHALHEGLLEIGVAAFEEKLHVADGFGVSAFGGETGDAGAKAAPDVVLETGARVVAVEIDIAGRDQKVAMDEIDDAVGEVRREKGAVVFGFVLLVAG